MDGRPQNLAEIVGAAFDWWQDAGVDCAFVDSPQDWLAAARAPEPPKAPLARRTQAAEPEKPTIVAVGGDRALWPTALPRFREWWLNEPSLAPAGARRVQPSGPANAELMVLVAMPEATDEDQLLGGNGGKLLDAMLGAMGLDRQTTYIAAALPARIAAPDWAGLAEQGFGEVLRHHIALAAPKRLLLLGRAGISALLSHDSPNNPANLSAFNHEGASVPAISAYDLETLLSRPALKAGVWSRWLEWTT